LPRDGGRLTELRFACCLLKGFHRYDIGICAVAHSGNASLRERAQGRVLADHDVDWQGRRLRQIRQPRHEKAICSCLCIGMCSLQHLCNQCPVVFFLRYLDEDVGPRINKERNVCLISSLASLSDAIYLLSGFPKRTILWEAIFEIATDRSRL